MPESCNPKNSFYKQESSRRELTGSGFEFSERPIDGFILYNKPPIAVIRYTISR